MNKQELFRIFDACQPTVAQVHEYLERISGNSPLNLVFIKDGKQTVTKKLTYDMGELLGVVIGSTIFYATAMNKSALKNRKVLKICDVTAFGQKNIHRFARPLDIADVKLLAKHKKEYAATCDMLRVFGYSAPVLQEFYLLFRDTDDTCGVNFTLDRCSDGQSTIVNFLRFRDIPFCAGWQVTI